MNEKIKDIIREMREDWAMVYFSEGTKKKNGEYSNVSAIEPQKVADRIAAANKRELAAKDAEIERLKAYIAENDINGDVAVACLTEIKKSVEEKMAKIERLRALVKELSDSLYAYCKCYRPCEGCDMADESKFDCPDKALRALVARAREEVGNAN